MLIGSGVYATKVVGTPSAEWRPLVVDKDSTIFHFWRRLHISSGIIIQFILMFHRHISHPIPRWHADTLRQVVNAIDCATFITASNHEIAVHHVNQVRFPLTTYFLHIHLLLLNQVVDDTALAYGTYKDRALEILTFMWQQTSRVRWLQVNLWRDTRHLSYIITQVACCTDHTFPVIHINNYRSRLAIFGNTKAVSLSPSFRERACYQHGN